jgi:hypothetical protein
MSALQKELEALKRGDGSIHAEDVVAWAEKHPKSALYAKFEWDDCEAAHQYRLWQARQVIALNIVTEKGERRAISLSIDRTSGGGYRDIEEIVRVPALREVMLQDALAELKRVQAKYRHLAELARVFVEIERADKRHAKKRVA